MMTNDESQLDNLFESYRAACPEVEPSANFMPVLWQRIEARRSFWRVFEHWGRTVMAASGALCLLLLVLNVVSSSQSYLESPTYMDALMADHTAEKTYYTEALRATPTNEEAPNGFHQ